MISAYRDYTVVFFLNAPNRRDLEKRADFLLQDGWERSVYVFRERYFRKDLSRLQEPPASLYYPGRELSIGVCCISIFVWIHKTAF